MATHREPAWPLEAARQCIEGHFIRESVDCCLPLPLPPVSKESFNPLFRSSEVDDRADPVPMDLSEIVVRNGTLPEVPGSAMKQMWYQMRH